MRFLANLAIANAAATQRRLREVAERDRTVRHRPQRNDARNRETY
jgi:hypothetical protein